MLYGVLLVTLYNIDMLRRLINRCVIIIIICREQDLYDLGLM